MVSVVLLRLSQGRSPFHADKQHLSHRLTDRGLSKRTAVRVIYLLALASGASGLILYAVTNEPMARLVAIQLALWWAALAMMEFAAVRAKPPAASNKESRHDAQTEKPDNAGSRSTGP
jgi:UDP-GlcNAc:undecaprenyl-phosphate GlcNAc-1-phosphate transferase